MAFQTVQDLDAGVTISLGGRNKKTGKNNPSQVEGYYLGSRKVDSNKAKSGFCYLHILQTPKGNVGVWGKTDLDKKILSVAPGTMVRATHTGMLATKNGDMYKFQVEVDPENTIIVSDALNAGSDEGTYGDEDGENDESSGTSGSEDEDYNEYATVAASRSAKVQELLNKNKKA